jgi:hypothetical protein
MMTVKSILTDITAGKQKTIEYRETVNPLVISLEEITEGASDSDD